jgi:hypothetical protein
MPLNALAAYVAKAVIDSASVLGPDSATGQNVINYENIAPEMRPVVSAIVENAGMHDGIDTTISYKPIRVLAFDINNKPVDKPLPELKNSDDNFQKIDTLSGYRKETGEVYQHGPKILYLKTTKFRRYVQSGWETTYRGKDCTDKKVKFLLNMFPKEKKISLKTELQGHDKKILDKGIESLNYAVEEIGSNTDEKWSYINRIMGFLRKFSSSENPATFIDGKPEHAEYSAFKFFFDTITGGKRSLRIINAFGKDDEIESDAEGRILFRKEYGTGLDTSNVKFSELKRDLMREYREAINFVRKNPVIRNKKDFNQRKRVR